MANYYFLATLLPPLKVGSPVELGSGELQFLLQQNLTKEDFELVHVLKHVIDIYNIRAVWQKQTFIPGGNYEQHDLEERLYYKEGLPKYILDYLDQYTDKELLANFPSILHRYFSTERQCTNAFLNRFLTFEWQWRLLFVALRARDLGRDLEKELSYEDLEDPFVSDLIAASKQKKIEPPAPFADVKALYEESKSSPLNLYQALAQWRFNFIEESIEWENFSIERILGYVAQLEICEEWLQLDKLKGLEIVEEIMEIV